MAPPAGSTTELPLVAFLGESQVGKSSLVNALAGAQLLPTTGTGAPRSQAVCEWAIPADLGDEPTWRVTATWLPYGSVIDVVEGRDATRANLLRKGIEGSSVSTLIQAARSLNSSTHRLDLSAWAAGRDTSWLALDVPRNAREARRQVEVLTAGWPAALAASVRVRSSQPGSVCLVDLPGLGHDDVGGQATSAWLGAHGSRVAAIVCVVGKRTPELIEAAIQRHFLKDELRDRLHFVATFADHLVEDHNSVADRRRAADGRRQRAAEHLRKLVGDAISHADALRRTFCLDPRPDSRFWQKVEFDGELERLRQMIFEVRPPPPRLPTKPATFSVARPAVPVPLPQSPPTSKAPLMAMQRGEDMEQWLSRVIAPALRQAKWRREPLRSGRQRLHLVALNGRGQPVLMITIYGTGEAYDVSSTQKLCIVPPRSDAAGRQLRDQLLAVARNLGVVAPVDLSIPDRSST